MSSAIQTQFRSDKMVKRPLERRNTLDGLLSDIHESLNRRYSCCDSDTGNSSAGELVLSLTSCLPDLVQRTTYTRQTLMTKDAEELRKMKIFFDAQISRLNTVLLIQLKIRDRVLRRRNFKYDIITASLQALSPKRRVDTKMKFSVDPLPGDSGFSQWCAAMQMVSRLPGGIPIEFRKRLWLTLADKHVQSKRIDWKKTKYVCLNEKTNPDDDKLGVQIVKDLHRTGCSMFSGEETEHNQALLKKVLLAYARWNKVVGYCQGFNMLAAIILEVMDWNEENALKVMIYLIEEVLPEGYFANHMRGLSVDMAVFRELLKMRNTVLSQHLDRLQYEAQDSGAGTSYEPPLTNVFTMQWFLTLFSNCLPKSTVLRVWDLIFLEGNEVLLRTALSIWGGLADRVLTVESADEFYSIMGVLTREMLEFGIMDANDLVKTICSMTPLSSAELNDMRDKYAYNIRPLTSPFSSFKKNLKLLYSDDEDECDDDNLAMATWCLSNTMQLPKSKGGPMGFGDISPGAVSHGFGGNHPTPSTNNVDAERMSLDISALKKQYAKLRERQKQAHVILTGAFANNTFSRQRLPVAVNHLLVGKKPLVRKNKPTSKITFEFKTPSKSPYENSTGLTSQRQTAAEATKKPTVQITRDGGGKTLSWAEVKKERQKHKDQAVNNVEESREVARDLSESSSCSSSSTELCDNVDLDDDDDDDDNISTLGDLSPEVGGKKYMSYLEEPLGIKASSSYEADEDSVSVDSNTLIASTSESTVRNIPSPGSTSTLGDDQLVSGSNSIRFEDTIDLSSYLSSYRRRSQDISPLSKSPEIENGSESKSYLTSYGLSGDFSPLEKSTPDDDDDDDEPKYDKESYLEKYRHFQEKYSFSKSPEEDEEEDKSGIFGTTDYLSKFKLSKDASPSTEASYLTKYTSDDSPDNKSPDTDWSDKYGFSSYIAKYKFSSTSPENTTNATTLKSPESDTNTGTTCIDLMAKYGLTDFKRLDAKSPESQDTLDASSYLTRYSLGDSISATKEEECKDATVTSLLEKYTTTRDKSNETDKLEDSPTLPSTNMEKFDLSSYLTSYSTSKKYSDNSDSPDDDDLLTGKGRSTTTTTGDKNSKDSSPKSPDNNSSPYDSSPDPSLSSPDLTSPEIDDSTKCSGTTKTASKTYSGRIKEDLIDKTASSNGTSSHSFNPFPTVKKIGYIANATAKLGLYAEKEFGMKENATTRSNSYKPKFQLPKTLK